VFVEEALPEVEQVRELARGGVATSPQKVARSRVNGGAEVET
jgi:hypothetical protein